MHALIAVLVIYSTFALIRSLLEYGRFAQSLYDARTIFYYIVILIAFDYLQTRRSIEQLSRNMLIGLALYSLFVLSYFLAPVGHPLAAAQEVNNWAYANRIGFSTGYYLILGVPMALLLLIGRDTAKTAKIWIFSALIAFLAVSVFSMSRTNTAAILLSLSLSYALYHRRYANQTRTNVVIMRLLVITFVLLVGVYLAVNWLIPLVLGESAQFTLETFLRRFDLNSVASYEGHVVPRIIMFREAVSLILHNPVLGYGFGYQFALAGWSVPVTLVDNSFLTIWIRLGLVGFLSFMGLILLLFKSIKRLLRNAHLLGNPYAQVLVISLAGGAIPLLIVSLNASWLITSSAVMPLLIIAGAIMGFSTQHESKLASGPS